MPRSLSLRSVAACLVLGGAIACSGGDSGGPSAPPPAPTVTSVTVSPATATLTAVGQTTALSAVVGLSNGSTGAQVPTWTSANPAVATVSNGTVTAVANGTTTITAAVGAVSGQATITVAIPTVQSVTVTPAIGTLVSLGETVRLTAAVQMSNGQAGTQTPTWTSSNPAVATVNAGTVTAVANGTATITAAVGTVNGSATLTVAQAVASVRLLPTDTVIKTAAQLRGTALDARGNVIANAPLTFTAVTPNITAVSATGALTPASTGVARVRVNSGTFNATSIVRTIWNVTKLTDLVPLYEYSASAGQRRAFSDVSQNHADARAALMGQVWSYLETVFPTSGSPNTDMHFTTWLEIWNEAIPFCNGVYFPNQDVYQACTTPNWTHWIVPGTSPNDFILITRWLSRQFLLSSMTRAAEFPWFLAGYTQWLSGGALQGATVAGAPHRATITDFRNGDTQNLLVPIDTLVRTNNQRFSENLPQRTPVAVRQAQAALFVSYLNITYPNLLNTIFARIRATPGPTVTNDMVLQDIVTRTGRTLAQLDTAYLVYARGLQP